MDEELRELTRLAGLDLKPEVRAAVDGLGCSSREVG